MRSKSVTALHGLPSELVTQQWLHEANAQHRFDSSTAGPMNVNFVADEEA